MAPHPTCGHSDTYSQSTVGDSDPGPSMKCETPVHVENPSHDPRMYMENMVVSPRGGNVSLHANNILYSTLILFAEDARAHICGGASMFLFAAIRGCQKSWRVQDTIEECVPKIGHPQMAFPPGPQRALLPDVSLGKPVSLCAACSYKHLATRVIPRNGKGARVLKLIREHSSKIFDSKEVRT